MIQLQETPKGFSLSFNGRLILEHSVKYPCVTLGTGSGKFNMSHGSFRIKDRVSAKNGLAEYAVQESGESLVSILLGGTLIMKAAVEGEFLAVSFKSLDPAFNRFWMKIPALASEHIYGCGEQYSVLDMRGRKVPIWVQEQGVGRGRDLITFLANMHSGSGGSWHTTYYGQPTFVSTAEYFCHVDTTAYSELDFRHKDFHVIHSWDIPGKIYFGTAGTLAETVGLVSALLGRQPAMPDWAWDGVWLGAQGGAAAVRGKLKEARIAGVKVAALWAQDWEGRRVTSFGKQLMWNWKHDEKLYPGLPEFINEIRKDGIRFLGYINPFLAVGLTDDVDGPIPSDFLYNEAKEKNYCVKNSEGRDYMVKITTFPAAVVDLTNPEAFEWIKGIIKKNMIEFGLSGWMADFGEYLPVDGVLYSGESPELIHNIYPVLWAKANYEAIREAGVENETVFFMRSGFSGTSKYAVSVWAGDQNVNWSQDDGLATVIPAALSLGFSGISSHHSDIGGYTTVAWIKRSKELFMRWAEQVAFTQTMRTHEGNRPEANWQFNSDEETLSHFARMSKIFVHIKQYHKHLADEYSKKGLPAVRHPLIHYENDTALNKYIYSYMYGRDIFVSPVIRPGIKEMRVYLPSDDWVHIWSGARFSGGFAEVDAPVGMPPVFYRAGSGFSGIFESLRSI